MSENSLLTYIRRGLIKIEDGVIHITVPEGEEFDLDRQVLLEMLHQTWGEDETPAEMAKEILHALEALA